METTVQNHLLKSRQSCRLKLYFGGSITFFAIVIALLYFLWHPWPIEHLDLAKKLQAPSLSHWLGTDIYGRDLLTLIMGSIHNSVIVAIFSILIGFSLGVLLGLLAAFSKHESISQIIMRLCDFLFSFPALILAIMLIATFGPSRTNTILAIGIANIPIFARLTFNVTGKLLSQDFITAARALGQNTWGMMRQNILPNLLPLLLVQCSLQASTAMLAEATLTYLNLGIQPPNPSWGRMLYEAQTLLFTAPEMAILPGSLLALIILGINQLGDGLRDLLIPQGHYPRF